MATSALSTLLTRLSQRIGDYLSEVVTTALAGNVSVICTTLGNYTAADDKYNRYWLYVVDYLNLTQYRKVSDYDNANTTLTVRGSNFISDGSNKATFELHKYDRNNKIRALNLAARRVYSDGIFRLLRDTTLITGNILPNSSFEDWGSASYPDYYSLTSATCAEETTTYRGIKGSSAVKVTASSAGGYLYLSSTTFPKLLDLMGKTVSLYAWAYPQTANDATIVIYTIQADGTAQTLTSSTTNPATKETLLKLENQVLNDDLVEVQIRFPVTTNNQYVIFDNARLFGVDVHEYILPLDFQNPLAYISQVNIQRTASQDEYVDDLLAYARFEPLFHWDIKDDATTKYLVTPTLPSERFLQIEGIAPLESNLSATTSTMTIEDPYIDLLIEMAAYCLFDMEAGLPSSQDRAFLQGESYKYLASYNMMKRNLKMLKPQTTQRIDRRLY